jgi:hypothetical protein
LSYRSPGTNDLRIVGAPRVRKGEFWIYPLQTEERLFVRGRFFVPRFSKRIAIATSFMATGYEADTTQIKTKKKQAVNDAAASRFG